MCSNTTQPEPNRKSGLTLYPVSTTTTKTFSRRRISTNYLNDDPGIMPLNSHPVSNQSIARLTPYRRRNRRNSKSLCMKTFAPDEYAHHHHPWHHHSFLSRKKKERYDQPKIIENLMMLPSKIVTCFHSSANLSINSATQKSFQKWMCDGATTIFASKKVTNGKPLFEQTSDSSNPQLCCSDLLIPPPHSNPS